MSLAELQSFMDGTPATDEPRVKWRLGLAKRSADEKRDTTLGAAIAAEGNALLFFTDVNSLPAAIADVRAWFDLSMIAYLTRRRDETTQPRLRARYAHVVASHAKRNEEGLRAVNAYVAALEHYRALEANDPAEAVTALIDLAPLAVMVARKYRARERVTPSLIALMGTRDATLRRKVLDLLITDQATSKETLEAVRDAVFATLSQMAAWSELKDTDAVARLGIRLDARLKRNDREPWLRALADVYRDVILRAPVHPLVKTNAARRAALIFQELGDVDARSTMLRFQREFTGQGLEYHTFNADLDEKGYIAASLRVRLTAAFEQGGPLGVLAYIGLSADFMAPARWGHQMQEQLEKAGTSTFSLMASTEAYAVDARMIGSDADVEARRDRLAWEQYRLAWLYVSYAMVVAAEEYVVNGQIRFEDFRVLLQQSWIGEREAEPQPNDLVVLLVAALRAYCAIYTQEQDDDAMVLVTDSLVLRFEAVLRKLARRLGVPDWVQRKDGTNLVDEVAGLPALLSNERIVNYLGQDLHVYAKYTLMSIDEGLRDKVAHAATHATDYNVNNLSALIVLVLRLAMRRETGQPVPK